MNVGNEMQAKLNTFSGPLWKAREGQSPTAVWATCRANIVKH